MALMTFWLVSMRKLAADYARCKTRQLTLPYDYLHLGNKIELVGKTFIDLLSQFWYTFRK